MHSLQPQLSLAIVAYNEEDRIEKAIASVPLADEVVVFDAGSTDRTVEVARGLGARVVVTDWPGFVAQKNRVLDACVGRFVISLDADEWLTRSAMSEVDEVIRNVSEDVVGWSFPRLSEWRGRPMRHGRWYPDRRVRLVRRGRARWQGAEPVDRLVAHGRVVALQGDIGHAPYRDLGEHLRTIDRYSRIQAASLRAAGVVSRRRDPWLHGGWHLVHALLLRRGVLDGPAGVGVAALGAVHSALKWHRVRHP